jgi:hypothetical protein
MVAVQECLGSVHNLILVLNPLFIMFLLLDRCIPHNDVLITELARGYIKPLNELGDLTFLFLCHGSSCERRHTLRKIAVHIVDQVIEN